MMYRQPKLLLVADTYYPKVDGTLRFMEEFLKRASANFHISLLVPDLGEHYHGKRNVPHVTFVQPSHHLQLSGYPSLRFSLRNLRLIRKAVQDADIVFVQGPAMISYLSIYYAHRYRKKVIFYLHVLSWELFAKFMPAWLQRISLAVLRRISVILFNRCDELLVPYHDLKNEIMQLGVHVPVTVARLGVDIERFSPSGNRKEHKISFGIDPARKVIGYVGRISREKNVSVLLQAFRRIKHNERAFLLMVGDGPEEQTAPFKALPNCRVTGFVRNVPDYLRAMDIFVMPSLTETTSLATLEAMSCGVPVIATRVGFIRHYLVKGHNGLFFPRRSSAMLAAKIEKLLGDPVLREKLGRNARRTVAYSFSWERSINKIKHILYKHNI